MKVVKDFAPMTIHINSEEELRDLSHILGEFIALRSRSLYGVSFRSMKREDHTLGVAEDLLVKLQK